MEKDYFGAVGDAATVFKERIDPKKEIEGILDELKGAVKDAYGRTKECINPLLNEKGIRRVASFLRGTINKTTHLSKYPNDRVINQQMKYLAEEFATMITKNAREWDIKDKSLVLAIVENGLYEAKLRATGGFEAEITGKSWQVSENIGNKNSQSRERSFFNAFRRNRGGDQYYG